MIILSLFFSLVSFAKDKPVPTPPTDVLGRLESLNCHDEQGTIYVRGQGTSLIVAPTYERDYGWSFIVFSALQFGDNKIVIESSRTDGHKLAIAVPADRAAAAYIKLDGKLAFPGALCEVNLK